jgi:cytoskeletal protein CcmA (bactofilin family)
MRRARYVFLGLLLMLLSAFSWMAVARAQSFRHAATVTVSSGQTVNSTLFAAGRTIDIAGNVNGDVFCAGANVTISGRVHGDVLCAAQNLTVTGQVTGDVRLAGQNVTLGGLVAGNATIAAQSLTQQSRSAVNGDVSLTGQDATLNGRIGRDVAGATQTLSIGGPVGRNISVNVNKLHLSSGARVTGNITYASNNTLSQASDAQVAGTVTKHAAVTHKHHGISAAAGWLFLLYAYVVLTVTAVVLVLVLPGLFERAAAVTWGRLGLTFLIGLVSSIVVPVVLVLLMATAIGIPLALMAGLMWLLAVLLSGPFTAYLLGRRILRRSNPLLVMLVGAAVVFLLYLLPFVGWLFWLIGMWVGLGALLMLARDMRRSRNEPKTKQTDVPPAAKASGKTTRAAVKA